jgi:hypothetical protein
LFDLSWNLSQLETNSVKEAITTARKLAKVTLLIGLKASNQRGMNVDGGVKYAFELALNGYFECEVESMPSHVICQFIQGMEQTQPTL